MASTTGKSAAIYPIQTVSGNQPAIKRYNEAATQSFLAGVPVMLSSGAVVEWDGSTAANAPKVAGVSLEFGASLATAGVALQKSFGAVQNEASAKKYLRPFFNDGKTGVVVATDDTIFYGQVGTTTAATDVGLEYGMTKDTDNHWYVDKAKTTIGTNTAVVIVALDPNDTTRGVWFRFVKQVQQLAPGT